MSRISRHEWEALSAYLDNQLTRKERRELEALLVNCADLQNSLEELRKTRLVLRNQPRLRAPRNFTLTPEMAGIKFKKNRSSGTFGMLRFASVLATVFLVIAIAGEFLINSYGAEPALVSRQSQSAPGPWSPIAGMGGGGGGGDSSFDLAEEAAMEKEVSVAPEGESILAPPGEPSGEEAGLATVTATVTLEPTATPTPLPPPTIVPHSEPQISTNLSGFYLLRTVQILLAILAIGAGFAAFYLRRMGKV